MNPSDIICVNHSENISKAKNIHCYYQLNDALHDNHEPLVPLNSSMFLFLK